MVMTLDAGGTTMSFSALCDGMDVAAPVVLGSDHSSEVACVRRIVEGFRMMEAAAGRRADAISFAFPGPSDYRRGVIGDVLNFPSVRGGLPLGRILEDEFGVPVFINNDGNLFAYGEARAGMLPQVNAALEAAGSDRRYDSIIGVTFGTGFGGGFVSGGNFLQGDNQVAAQFWCQPNVLYPDMIAEESVSVRGVQRVYRRLSGDGSVLSAEEICAVADGRKAGDGGAAREAFRELGTAAGAVIACALNFFDGLVVVGGGLSGAARHIMPALLKELRRGYTRPSGEVLPRLQSVVYDWDSAEGRAAFLKDSSGGMWLRDNRRTAVAVSSLGTARAVSLGAYHYAVDNMA